MEKLMPPDRLDLDPGSVSAAKEWRHCLKTFKNFTEVRTSCSHARKENKY